MWRHGQRHAQKACYKYWNYRSQSVIYKLTCVAYKNKIPFNSIGNSMRQKSHWLYIKWECQWCGMGLDRFYHKNSARHRFGDDKMFNFTKLFERNPLVIRKRIRSQWSISTIICICTIAYEDYSIYSSVCVVYHWYYVAPSRISHI